MHINKAYKFRIYPNKTQEILIAKTIGSSRFIYKSFLALWNTTYMTFNARYVFTLGAMTAPLVGIAEEETAIPLGLIICGSGLIATVAYGLVRKQETA